MQVDSFIDDPFGKSATHEQYGNSFLHMRPAPEFASGEVVLASLIRNVGFGTPEGQVPRSGAELLKRVQRAKPAGNPRLAVDTWQSVLESSLKSPKQPNQSAKRFLQLCPLVPDSALYSSSARLTSNSWNPGEMVKRIVAFGSPSQAAASRLWRDIFDALSVTRNEDDPWAVSLQSEFEAWRHTGAAWTFQEFQQQELVDRWRAGGGTSAASRFVEDLRQILHLKRRLTRRQWVSMLESLLRLACASHVLWLCRANQRAYQLFLAALQGTSTPSDQETRELLGVGSQGFWRYGQLAAETIEEYARGYLRARVGLNTIMYLADEAGCRLSDGQGPLSSPVAIRQAAVNLFQLRAEFPVERLRDIVEGIVDSNPRVFAVKKGVGSNIKEFLRHTLGQRQTAEEGMKSYDQGYWLRKNGYHSSAKWIVSAGPVAVLLLVYCCARRTLGPATTDDLCRHLGEYGITVRLEDVTGAADLGPTLRRMGLVTDSPDAEGGMLVRNPFGTAGGAV
ncbi:hypothetical protein AYO47_02120 [Planctomyces sp. SCGC AG-212-M04]|nr:hypothetical protein AYO47_02120 [Planctomyces sp. SCGC AG-212-M04]